MIECLLCIRADWLTCMDFKHITGGWNLPFSPIYFGTADVCCFLANGQYCRRNFMNLANTSRFSLKVRDSSEGGRQCEPFLFRERIYINVSQQIMTYDMRNLLDCQSFITFSWNAKKVRPIWIVFSISSILPHSSSSTCWALYCYILFD